MKDFEKEVLSLLTRTKNTDDFKRYLNNEKIADKIIISIDERRFSQIALVLLTTDTGQKIYIYIKKSVPNKSLNETKEEIQKRIIAEFQITKEVYQAFHDYSTFYIPYPISIFPEQLIYIMEECPGSPLSKLLRQSLVLWSSKNKKNILLDNLQLVGRWLNIFHEKFYIKDSVFNLEEMKAYCSLRLEKILRKNLIDETLSAKVIGFFEHTIPEVPKEDLRVSIAHCDFSPGNILIDEQKISIIDFTRAQPWSIFVDITHLYHHLNLFLYKPIFSKIFVDKAKDSFLNGYGMKELKHKKLFTLFLIQNKLCQLVYLSRKQEHSFKSNLYHKIIIKNAKRWLEETCRDK